MTDTYLVKIVETVEHDHYIHVPAESDDDAFNLVETALVDQAIAELDFGRGGPFEGSTRWVSDEVWEADEAVAPFQDSAGETVEEPPAEAFAEARALFSDLSSAPVDRREEFRQAAVAARLAADGDSNDAEIEALQNALDIAEDVIL